MEFIETEFEGLIVIKPKVFRDARGYFLETYNAAHFKENKVDYDFVQDNQSQSKIGVLRGLHFQAPPHEQGKLVSVIKGSVRDIAVDIRKKSPTYGKYFSIVLNSNEKNMVFIPPGFAHGFITLENDTIFSYKCTGNYNPGAEGTLLWNDPDLGINWEINNPIISDKDNQAENFKNFISPFE